MFFKPASYVLCVQGEGVPQRAGMLTCSGMPDKALTTFQSPQALRYPVLMLLSNY